MVSTRLVFLPVVFSISSCAWFGQASRSDFATASDSFGKTLDAANGYVTTRLGSYRKESREAAFSLRDGQLRFALISGNPPAGNSWKQPLDRTTLLCASQASYFNSMTSWTQVQAIRQPLSTLSQPSKDTGFTLFYSSIKATYSAAQPSDKPAEVLSQKYSAQCAKDLVTADTALGLTPAGVKEATGIPQIDAGIAAYKALDVFFGQLGSLIDDEKRVAALKEWIKSGDTQQAFHANVGALRDALSVKTENVRLATAQSFVIGYLEYQIAYGDLPGSGTSLPTDKAARALKVNEILTQKLQPLETKLLQLADAYDGAELPQDIDQFKALDDQFLQLVDLANEKKISMSKLVAQAQQLQTVFNDGKDAYTKYRAVVSPVPASGASK